MDSKGLQMQNELLQSANDENNSNLISKYFMKDKSSANNQDDQNTLPQNKSQSQPPSLEKLQKFFRKNIKLRNATIKKNFWERKLTSSGQTNQATSSNPIVLRIIDLIPVIQLAQALELWISNYVSNDNYAEFFGRVTSEITVNTTNTNTSALTPVETLTFIDNNSLDFNLLMNAKPKDNNQPQVHRMNIYKLIQYVYKRIKAFKSNQEGEFITKFLSFYRSINPNNKKTKDIIGKLYFVFPNINFELTKIKNISLSSKFKLNKMLISKHTTHISFSPKGVPLKSGFITMSSEKRIITLTDDTNNKANLKSSQSLKHIIFGIWINLKEEEISSLHSTKELEGIIKKNSLMIYQKCLEYIMSSSQIETIYSPSPDEGVFLLLLFFKGVQLHYEVKVVPNEEDKTISNSSSNNYIQGNEDCDQVLSAFKNQWLVLRKKFSLLKNKMVFDIKEIVSTCKINPMSQYVNILHGIEKSDLQMIQSKSNTNNINPNSNANVNANANVKYDDSLSPIRKNYSNMIDPLKELFDPPGIKQDGYNDRREIRNNMHANTRNINARVNYAKRLKFNDIEIDGNDEEYEFPYSHPNEMDYPKDLREDANNGTSNNYIPQYHKMSSSTSHKEFEPIQQLNNDQKMFSNIVNNTNTNSNSNMTKQIQPNSNDQKQIHKKVQSMNMLKLQNQIPNQYQYFAQSQCNVQTQTQKCDEGSQTISYQLSSNSNYNEDNQTSQNTNSQNIQIQSLINTINEQAQSMKFLQNKVVQLEELLEKINGILIEREATCICQGRNKQMPTEIKQQSPLNEEEFELSDDKVSESLKNSKSDSFANKDKSNHDVSSLNLSTNNNEKTIEVPQIKYNIMTCLSNDNETENDIHQY